VNCNTGSYETREVDKLPPVCNSCTNLDGPIQAPQSRDTRAGPLADFHDPPKSESIGMQFDSVTLHQVWRETNRRLESLARDVRENKNVREASEFARWLQFSGILKILEASPQPEPLLVDGVALRKQVRDLVYDCGECFRNGKADAKYAASDIAEINRKLEVIAAHISTLSPPVAATTSEAGNPAEPVLHVIAGGA